ncbi:MAG: hypothetical protein RL642_48 [Bacteroidota bacterium]
MAFENKEKLELQLDPNHKPHRGNLELQYGLGMRITAVHWVQNYIVVKYLSYSSASNSIAKVVRETFVCMVLFRE